MSGEKALIVLSHLADNAVRHNAKSMRLEAEGEGAIVRMIVSNDGDPISESNRDKIFDAFFTTRRDTGGTGMGLAIVQAVMTSHGGSIRLLPTETGRRVRTAVPGRVTGCETSQTRSMMIAGAMPPAAHIVTSPRLRSRRSSSSRTVPIRIDPVAPMGWPSAIEPPLTLTLSRSSLRSRMNFSATTAKASLISNRSISSSVSPAFASTFRAAGTGAFSIRVGESPILAIATTRARGFNPCFLA